MPGLAQLATGCTMLCDVMRREEDTEHLPGASSPNQRIIRLPSAKQYEGSGGRRIV